MHRQNRTFENIDAWFKQIREKYANQMQCGKGCTACCHGLFDISLADAVEVARGFQRLTYSVQRDVYSEAERLYGVDFRQDYDRIDAVQEARSARVARQAGLDNPRAITFIPSIIVEYDKFWKNLLTQLP